MTVSDTDARTQRIRTTVHAYLDAVAAGVAADIAALYADDATLEDPAGSEPRVGRAAIAEFYKGVEATENTTELLTLRIAGSTAAFHFRVVTKAGEQTYEIEPIDVMTFDDEGRITSMRAVWAPGDMRVR
ncbi:steroid delta-isomerase [Rhodococcus pyridinivorans]|uniref:nuclear transport factor 2 family protein n=1 Tax=Rhodococcus pyridinivorans TaxID=103816 RepID=UPI0007CD9374|nr:nuclear transport factor 2 family protein [Rhodococcus pyridinivorans]MCD5421703.1 nuclear transport factor 2 family protein [Rhodococcus pyridinivorans]SEC29053.1 steroid delta-isomerase [Rhodococcus pyridinivorans]